MDELSFTKKYDKELQGQVEFLQKYLPRIDSSLDISDVQKYYSDGVVRGNLLEFKTQIENLNAVLSQTIKLLSSMRLKGRPIPATAVVEAVLQNDTTETELTEDSTFYLENTPYHFMSLLRQRIINASITGLTRLDGRRWRVTLQFLQPINTLEGMTFAIMDTRFQNVSVSVNGHLLEMVKPWHYADMPLQHCFSIGSLLYNKAQMYNASLVGFDLFARQNVALFYFKKSKNGYDFPNGTSTVDLIFDFKGISDNFVFDKHHLVLNPVILVNAKVTTTTLSSASPIVRITGYTPGNPDESQLMHLIPPAEEQLFGKTPIEIRRVSSDRFNQASLMRLINSLTTKFHSDYYAFLEMRSAGLSEVIHNMQEGLLKLSRAIRQEQIHSTPGVYLIIQRDILASQKNISLDIDIVTTPGAAVNSKLTPESRFIVPSGLNASAMRMIADPVPGFDEINDSQSLQSYVRYQQITNDRIVTPADIKILCYTELTNRYSIVPDMVRDMTVSHRQQLDKSDCGYAFWVNIRLQDNPFVRRSFSDKILEAESFLEKRIKVRSSCIYPIYVNIQMDTDNTDF